MEIPPHRSFSQLDTFRRCQHQYYLSKVAKVPEVPAVWLTAGNAVHTMLELVNRHIYETGEIPGA